MKRIRRKNVCCVAMVLGVWTASGQQAPSVPVLRLNLPQPETAIQSASAGVRITPTYGASLGIFYWDIATPAHLSASTGACTFDLPLTSVPHGAATLTGKREGVVDTFQVDSFRPLSESRAFGTLSRIAGELQMQGWTPSPNVVQHTQAETHVLLRGGTGVSVRDLRCGPAHLSFFLIRKAGSPVSVSYGLLYDGQTR